MDQHSDNQSPTCWRQDSERELALLPVDGPVVELHSMASGREIGIARYCWKLGCCLETAQILELLIVLKIGWWTGSEAFKVESQIWWPLVEILNFEHFEFGSDCLESRCRTSQMAAENPDFVGRSPELHSNYYSWHYLRYSAFSLKINSIENQPNYLTGPKDLEIIGQIPPLMVCFADSFESL